MPEAERGPASASPPPTPRRASADAVDLAYDAGGGSSVFTANALQRCFRDVHTGTQHLQVSTRIYETVGRLLFGLETDASTL